MATNDVPGSNPCNGDELHVGCWAEHQDGSLILVEGVEYDRNISADRVIYVVFDVSKPKPVEYRDSMPVNGFKVHYSWDPAKPKSVKWTWHDKTAFPWDRVIKSGFQDGPKYADPEDTISAAEAIAKQRSMKGAPVSNDRKSFEDAPPGTAIERRLKAAFDAFFGTK